MITIKPLEGLFGEDQVRPLQMRKLRERSADSVLYTLPRHRVDFPQTVTVTSTLPTPRKGNPGTVKTVINVRMTDVLDQGMPTQRNVPVITKVETSFPVGSDQNTQRNVALVVAQMLLQEDAGFDGLFYSGMLPEDGATGAIDENDDGSNTNGGNTNHRPK